MAAALPKQPVHPPSRTNESDYIAQSHPPPTTPSSGPPITKNVPEPELSKLHKEIAKLWEKFNNYISSHEACCMHHSNPHSDTSSEASDSPDPLPYITQDLPPTFQSNQLAPPPLSSELFPQGTLEVVKLIFDSASPLYLGTHRDRQLQVSTIAD
ncbi:hypothetical protein EDC04DRAFT_2913002 [Pisolithus marmoratus]|nr:hypothetical protein EDC04DRAFT_2913002 [Pisolithus marmoratus]